MTFFELVDNHPYLTFFVIYLIVAMVVGIAKAIFSRRKQ